MWFNGYCLQFFFLGKWVDFQNYFYFSTELQNLVNTYIPCISEFPWVWLRHHTGRCRCWLSSYFLNLCPMSIANCAKNYSRAYVYITFVHYGFGLHTYHISLKVQFFLACIHTVTYHSSKKIKYPKEVKKTSQGDANELKQGRWNLGQGGWGNFIFRQKWK